MGRRRPLYGVVGIVPKIGKWLAAPMKNSMGIESQALVRDARNARRAHFGRSAGAGVPDSAVARVAAMIFFWSGQMIIHTFMNMIMPSPPPTAIAIVRLLPPSRTEGTTSQAV